MIFLKISEIALGNCRGNYLSWSLYFDLYSIFYIANEKLEKLQLERARSQMEHFKTQKNPCKKKREATGPKKREMTYFCIQEKKPDTSESGLCLPKLSVRRGVVVRITPYRYICWPI